MRLWKNGKNLIQSLFVSFLLLFSCFFALGCSKNVAAKNESANVRQCKIRYSWWGNEIRTEYTLKGIEIFHSQNPDIYVFPESAPWNGYEDKFEQAFKEGTNADVMQINFDWLFKYSPEGNGFYDLNKLYEYIDLYNFTSDDLDYGTINGKLNAIPIAFNSIIPIYNKAVFDERNLKIPSTWQELFSVAKKFKQDGMYVFGIGGKHFFLLSLAWFEQAFSKKMFSDNSTLNVSEDELESFFDFTKSLIDENVVYSKTINFDANEVKNGKLAGVFAWCNESSKFASLIELIEGNPVLGNFICHPEANESGWYLKPVSMYAIKKDCKNPVEAAKFVNFLLNNQEFALLQKNEKGVPLSNKSLTALMENGKLESLQYTSLMKIRFNSEAINQMLPIMENKDVVNAFLENALDYSSGKKSRKAAAHDFAEFFKNPVLATQG